MKSIKNYSMNYIYLFVCLNFCNLFCMDGGFVSNWDAKSVVLPCNSAVDLKNKNRSSIFFGLFTQQERGVPLEDILEKRKSRLLSIIINFIAKLINFLDQNNCNGEDDEQLKIKEEVGALKNETKESTLSMNSDDQFNRSHTLIGVKSNKEEMQSNKEKMLNNLKIKNDELYDIIGNRKEIENDENLDKATKDSLQMDSNRKERDVCCELKKIWKNVIEMFSVDLQGDEISAILQEEISNLVISLKEVLSADLIELGKLKYQRNVLNSINGMEYGRLKEIEQSTSEDLSVLNKYETGGGEYHLAKEDILYMVDALFGFRRFTWKFKI